MSWPWFSSDRSEIKAIVLGIVIIDCVALLAIHVGNVPQKGATAGF